MTCARSTAEIIPDAEVEFVHAHANFGSLSKRRVVDEGVLKYFFGFTSGSTQFAILIEHGLLNRPKHMTYRTTLTAKGRRYLRALGLEVLAAFGANP